jgi:hypothetical protein
VDKAGIFRFTLTGARPPAGHRGGVARVASFDGCSCQTPENWGDERRRDVAVHSIRILGPYQRPAALHALATPFYENHKRRQHNDQGNKRLRKYSDLMQPLESIRF